MPFKKVRIDLIILILLILWGSLLRFYSLTEQPSYWNDESHVAVYARSIVQTGQAVDDTGFSTGLYQLALYYITALSFTIFGVTEFAGRFPSVVIGILLIPTIFFITKKLLGPKEAFISSFLMSVSQMQLAWSTQLRPYIWMELFTLIVIYLAYLSLQMKKNILDKYLIYGGILTIISFLFHGTGLINGLILTGVFIYKILKEKEYRYFFLIIPAAAISLYIISYTPFFSALFRFNTYLYHYFVFLAYHYNWLLLGAGIGSIVLWFTNKKLSILLTTSIILIFVIALFKIHDRYVRYSITAFPLLYMLFSAGVIGTINYVIKKHSYRSVGYIVFLIFLLAWPFYKEKFILLPQRYYSINADMRENPIVNYKLAFEKIGTIIEGKENVIVMDAWYDRVQWYLPGTKYAVLFETPANVTKAPTIDSFEKMKKEYTHGVVIVENWESQTKPEMQTYLRKTLKYEFDTQTIKGNEKDPWSISVYSWGL